MNIFKPKYIQVVTLQEALVLRGGNQTMLAKELGISRGKLRNALHCGGYQLLEVVTEKESISFKYINKGWTK